MLSKVGKPRYEEVEIEGLGTVGIRQRTRLQESKRMYACFVNGRYDTGKAALEPFYRLIDQVMVDESTPMFSEDDVMTLANCPEGELDGLFAAVQQFNNEVVDDPKKQEGSSESDGS